VQGRERIYLNRFWNGCPETPRGSMKIRGATMLPCTHGRMRCTMPSSSFGAFSQDAATTRRCSPKGGKITMPVFAIGARSFSARVWPMRLRFAASNVTGSIVPNSGHWIMEENPQATIKLVTDFFAKSRGTT